MEYRSFPEYMKLNDKVTAMTSKTRLRSKRATPEENESLAAHARRELATRSLYEFVKQAWHVVEPKKPFKENWHIRAICDHLQAVSEGRIAELLVNVPPGTTKSLLTCVFWPCWEWTWKPSSRWLFASYAETLSMRDSVKCRNLLVNHWYQERWPLVLRDDQNTKGLFENNDGGWRMSTSVGGKGTGHHPDRIVVDDPHTTLKAESDPERRAVVDWWDGTIESRGLIHGCAHVCIMQRLHGGDLSAHLIDKGTWEHICLPMRYEEPVLDKQLGRLVPRMKTTSIGFQDPRKVDGELLWPSVYTDEKVARLEEALTPYHAAGQLQQRPTPRGGGKFKREWFGIIPMLPANVRRFVRYWDKAGTKTGTGARTSGTLLAEYEDETAGIASLRTRWVIVDVTTGMWEAAEREAVIKQTALADQAKYGHVEVWVEQEPGSGGKESAQATVGNLAGFWCQFDRVTGAKEVRADPLASQSSVGKVKLLAAEWNASFLQQVEAFPLGKLKDMVDSTSGAFNKMMTPGGGMGAGDLYTGTRAEDSPLHGGRIRAADLWS